AAKLKAECTESVEAREQLEEQLRGLRAEAAEGDSAAALRLELQESRDAAASADQQLEASRQEHRSQQEALSASLQEARCAAELRGRLDEAEAARAALEASLQEQGSSAEGLKAACPPRAGRAAAMALDPAALRIMLNEILRPIDAQMNSMNTSFAGHLTAIKEMDGRLSAGVQQNTATINSMKDDSQAHSVRMDESELKFQRQQQGTYTDMEQDDGMASAYSATVRLQSLEASFAEMQRKMDQPLSDPWDIKKNGYILGLIWKQICAYMRTNGCWTPTTVLACNKYQGLCYTTVRDEPIDLVMLSSWTESEVAVETCAQELRSFGLTEQQVQDLPAAVNSAYHE
ncbi:unnamed protein product, partial [Prorocentrum cordatum]